MKMIIHVGSGKAASTTLQEIFQEHPKVFYLRDQWHDQIRIKPNNSLEVAVYSSEMLGTWVTHNRIGCVVEKDGFFERVEKTAIILSKLFPNAEILFVRKDFTEDTLLSSYSQAVKTGFSGKPADIIKNQQYIDFTRQDDNIAIWKRYFSNVHVVEYEELKVDSNAFYRRIEEIVGFKLAIDSLNKTKKNTKWSTRQIYIARSINALANRIIFSNRYYKIYIILMRKFVNLF
jgi:hypothetical protein